eukprot:jgi/Picre1/29621/NNA_005006.t1
MRILDSFDKSFQAPLLRFSGHTHSVRTLTVLESGLEAGRYKRCTKVKVFSLLSVFITRAIGFASTTGPHVMCTASLGSL